MLEAFWEDTRRLMARKINQISNDTADTQTLTSEKKRSSSGSNSSETKRYTKANLPSKVCLVCGRPFEWRKKWERCWDEVRYCSDRCRGQRNLKAT